MAVINKSHTSASKNKNNSIFINKTSHFMRWEQTIEKYKTCLLVKNIPSSSIREIISSQNLEKMESVISSD